MIKLTGISKHSLRAGYTVLEFSVDGQNWSDTLILTGDAQSYLNANEAKYEAEIASRRASFTGFKTVTDMDGNAQDITVTLDEHMAEPVPFKARRSEILAELKDIDLKSIRPSRNGETDRLAKLEEQAVLLREELAAL